MYRTALRLLRDREDAQEAVQDALHNGWRGLDRFGRDEQMKSWLFKILTNTCIDRLRTRTRVRDAGTMCDVEELEVDGREAYGRRADELLPDEAAENGELRRILDLEIHRLAPAQQAVVQLVVVEQMSYLETAEILDVPVGTVRSRLNRARTQLCENLADLLDDQAERVQAQPTARLKLVTR